MKVDAQHFLEGFLGRVDDVAPLAGRHAGVVHQGVEPAEGRERVLDEGGALCGIGNVAAENREPLRAGGGRRPAQRQGLPGRGLVPRAVDGHRIPAPRELDRGAPPEPSARSRHEDGGRLADPWIVSRMCHGPMMGRA